MDPSSIPAAAILDGSVILATSAIHLITCGPCLPMRPFLGESGVKLSRPSVHPLWLCFRSVVSLCHSISGWLKSPMVSIYEFPNVSYFRLTFNISLLHLLLDLYKYPAKRQSLFSSCISQPVFEIRAGPLPEDRQLCGKTSSFLCLLVLGTGSWCHISVTIRDTETANHSF